jgi:hypothetical protein
LAFSEYFQHYQQAGASLDLSIWDGRFLMNEAPECNIEEWQQPYEKQIADGVDLQPHSEIIRAMQLKDKVDKNRTYAALKKMGTYNDVIFFFFFFCINLCGQQL